VAWTTDRALHVVELGGSERTLRSFASELFSAAWSPDGTTLAVTEGYEDMWILDPATGATRCAFHGVDNTSSAFAPDGKRIAFVDGNSVRLGELAGCTSRVLYAHEHFIDAVAFAPDGAHLASAGPDRKIGLWSVTDESVRMLEGHELESQNIAFSRDGRTLASCGSDRTVRLWDVATGQARQVIRVHALATTVVAFGKRDAVVVSGGQDDTIYMSDVATGETIAREEGTGIGHFEQSPDGGHSFAGFELSPDGERILSQDQEGMRLWTLPATSRLPADPAEMKAWLARQTRARIGTNDVLGD
jgi:WD40 repeat protein